VNWPLPTHGPLPVGWKDEQEVLVDSGHKETGDVKKLKPYRTLGDVIKGLDEEKPTILDFSERKKKYLDMVPEGGNWRALPEEIQKESMGKAWEAKGGRSGWWRRLSYDLPAPTILNQPNHASSALCHPDEVRALTLKECALIQEFPDDWEFYGTPYDQYSQVGNAVPITLGRVAGEVISSSLDKAVSNEQEEDQIESKGVPDCRIVYLHAHVRRRQWYKDGETYVTDKESDEGAQKYKRPKKYVEERVLD
ncbi:MAG: DNA cytosine methyltransferase, partial [Candidatus Korarchaeota archaeon]|nr:DNA cytosine methyltransferase [Candidatus Korarchaeota archaeon]NIW12892.1 DNA cytosine methyltransferase [Candidatus Thorarchaeota archaeon]NIW51084.1 DNA cytosine methyltransferase [Candidatus Korarchaeota archaeon]